MEQQKQSDSSEKNIDHEKEAAKKGHAGDSPAWDAFYEQMARIAASKE